MLKRHDMEAAKWQHEKLKHSQHIALLEKQSTQVAGVRTEEALQTALRSRYHDHVELTARQVKDRHKRDDINRWKASHPSDT